MVRRIAVAALVASSMALTTSVRSRAEPAQTTVWDGVFTDAQAARGFAVFQKKCSFCHRDDLRGNNDGGPPLRGLEFTTRWKDLSVDEMVSAIQEIMPRDEPGSL